MVKRAVGKFEFAVRLDQEVFYLLQARATEIYGEHRHGSSGGASRLVRAWIHEKLGLPPPVEWGDKNPERNKKLRAKKQAEKGLQQDGESPG